MSRDTRIDKVIPLLDEGLNVPQVAKRLKIKPSTLYQIIYRSGYNLKSKSWLEPIHPDQEAA